MVLACRSMTDDIVKQAVLELTAALDYLDRVRMTTHEEISYETMQRSGFKRKDGWRRKYTLADARRDANTAAIRLRNAWQLLDPVE